MRFTEKILKQLVAAGTIRGYEFTTPEKDKTQKAVPKAEQQIPKAILFIADLLEKAGIVYETEYRFHDERRFRFDFAVPALKLAIEYEGLMSKKSRHTTVAGYTMDAEKYNLAQSMGWRVLRYTAKNYRDFERDLKNIK